MATPLTGLTPAVTYDSLLKLGDNNNLTSTSKVVSDGLGNDTLINLSTTAFRLVAPANVGGTDGFYFDGSTNRVGIGVANPIGLFQIGSGTNIGSSSNPAISIGGISNLFYVDTNRIFTIAEGVVNSVIGATNKFLVNTIFGATATPTARLHVRGSDALAATNAFLVQNSTPADLFTINNAGGVGIGVSPLSGRSLNTASDITVSDVRIGRGGNSVSTNTAIGANALNANQATGENNTAVGRSSMQFNTTGGSNVAFGESSLYSNTTGGSNVAVGRYAMYFNLTSSNNTAVGNQALLNSTAGPNTAVGDSSLKANTTGINNTAVGSSALNANTSGGSNTAIGSNALILNTTSNNNTAVGMNALLNNTAAGNTAVGQAALSTNTTGTSNSALGRGALANNSTASNNTAVGSSALNANTTGTDNTAVGAGALALNTTGNYNTVIGNIALAANTTGNFNSTLGAESLNKNTTGQSNVAIGYTSMLNNTSGSNNISIGVQSLLTNTTGSSNIAIGIDAGRWFGISGNNQNTTGSYSIFIGYETRANANNETNQIVIGNSVTGEGSNSVVLGNTSVVKTVLRRGVEVITGPTSGTFPSVSMTIRGTGATQSTSSLLIQNNTPNEILRVRDDKVILIGDTVNISLATGTGTKIGTAADQKLAFYNATPIIQPTAGSTTITFTENTGTTVNSASTFGGYTILQVVQALKDLGLLA